MLQQYIEKRFRKESLLMIVKMNEIIAEYLRKGYVLTVRQLYYQLVARGLIENTQRSYKNIAGLINDARLAGQMDWDAIEDRTRSFITRGHWEDGADIVESCARSFHKDMWENQANRVFVIVEKEALVGVLERTCRQYDVPLLAARGYPSSSVVRDFAVRTLLPHQRRGQVTTILHLGDHDPSGLDMTRDLEERIDMFTNGGYFVLKRLALNMDQVEELQPPENPAKTEDARYAGYAAQYGDSSWELDALSPEFLNELIIEHIQAEIDQEAWETKEAEIEEVKDGLHYISENFDEIIAKGAK